MTDSNTEKVTEQDIKKYQETINNFIKLCENCPKLIEQKKQIREWLVDLFSEVYPYNPEIINEKLKEFDEMKI